MASFRTEGVAIVTGAANGIGLGIANALAEAGAQTVVFADIDEAAAQAAAKASAALASHESYHAVARKLDVTQSATVTEVVESVAKEFGRLDYLINSAGVDTTVYASVPDNDMEDFDRVLGVNARGMLLCSRAAIKVMEKQEPRVYTTRAGTRRDLGRGAIVNITSALSYAAVPGKVAYITSKHAALGITKSTAQDTTRKGIRVNALCPSWVRTPMYTSECSKFPPVQDFIKAAVGLGRPAEADEVGAGAVYLCSPAASYVNGIGLIMDAGLTLTVHLGI